MAGAAEAGLEVGMQLHTKVLRFLNFLYSVCLPRFWLRPPSLNYQGAQNFCFYDMAGRKHNNAATPEIHGLESSRKIFQLPYYCSWKNVLYMFLKRLGSYKNMQKDILKNFDFLSWFL